jgi:hypothetical protein
MRVRGLASVVGVALIAASCGGGGSRPSRGGAIHLDGKPAQGDYVVEADASGARFLVPAPFLAGQGSRTFDVAAPTGVIVGEPPNAITVPPPYRIAVASATAILPHSAHVELLATGESGRRFALSWEETCGWTQQGSADVGGTGGQGLEILRSPAVTLVKLPPIHGGVPSCYLAATASTTTVTRRLRVAIIDY